MNRKFIVPFETAKKLAAAGCNCVTNYYYKPNGDIAVGAFGNMDIAAPAYCELLDWFDSQGICITTKIVGKTLSYACTIKYFINGHVHDIDTMKYVNREDALNEAALVAIRILIVKQHCNENKKQIRATLRTL